MRISLWGDMRAERFALHSPILAVIVFQKATIKKSLNLQPSSNLNKPENYERDYNESEKGTCKTTNQEWTHNNILPQYSGSGKLDYRHYKIIHERLNQGAEINAENESNSKTHHLVL